MRLEVKPLTLHFREPLVTAHGTLSRRTVLTVRLHDGDGIVGTGEASPLEPYDGVALEEVREQIEDCREPLGELGGAHDRELTLQACRERCPLPQALAAIDLALWDLAARRARRPVSALLAEDPAAEVAVNAVIGAGDRAEAARRAGAAVAMGFDCLKLKVGVEGDFGRVAVVRAAAGRETALRLDANGAWSVEQAVEALRGLAAFGIELAEEPVHGLDGLHAVRDALDGRVAIAMDETAAQPGATGSGATDAVCLKIARCGGITGVLEAAAVARAAGSDVYLASSFDGPVGIAAALHAAAALGLERHCGLATLDLFDDCPDPFPVRRGAIAVPTGPGLGLR